jgi:hypothetical protein
MIGSSLIILAILIWFTHTNFIQNQNLNYILILLFIQNLFCFIIIFAYINNGATYLFTIERIKLRLPVKKEDMDFIINKKKIYTVILLTYLFIILNFCELLAIENFPYYFITTSLIIFILIIIIWIRALFENLMNPIIDMYLKLKYDILSGKITDVKVIRNKYLLIGGKPPEVVILNKKGKFEEF